MSKEKKGLSKILKKLSHLISIKYISMMSKISKVC